MSKIQRVFRSPATLLIAGALIVGAGFAGAQLRHNVSSPSMLNWSGAAVQPVGNVFPETGPATTLQEFENELTTMAEKAGTAVVTIVASDSGQGSGFVYRSDGWIVTNGHVADGNETVKVLFNDGKELEGKVYSANDPTLDIALIKVSASDLPTLRLADSDRIRVGQYAVAIGAPFGYESTVTIGHVSGLHRSATIPVRGMSALPERAYYGMIQTDASINPGNSGGPLIDLSGNVIGVNSYIVSPTGTSVGAGFAIPAKTVRIVADEIIQSGKLKRAFLGLAPADLKPFELKEINLPGGARVATIDTDTPAGRAGLREGDIITKINGTPVLNEADVRIAMVAADPGDNVSIEYRRGNDTRSANVQVAAVPEDQRPQTRQPQSGRVIPDEIPDDLRDRLERQFGIPFGDETQPQTPESSGPVRLGARVQELTDETRTQYQLPKEAKGVVIISIDPNSNAAMLGLEIGDVLREINGKAVGSLDEVSAALQSASSTRKLTVRADRFVDGQRTSIQGAISR
ncbi:MAG: trypsin-like peptidase domain-containing protein [Fimbriimonadaceae bacterium]|nr:trypsin-like peptidase domain-containing protein [Fimbriimonadaceae bacterium]